MILSSEVKIPIVAHEAQLFMAVSVRSKNNYFSCTNQMKKKESYKMMMQIRWNKDKSYILEMFFFPKIFY